MHLIEAFELKNIIMECGKHGQATHHNDESTTGTRTHIGEQSWRRELVVRVNE